MTKISVVDLFFLPCMRILAVLYICWAQNVSASQDVINVGNYSYLPQEEDLGDVFEGSENTIEVFLPYCKLNHTSFTVTARYPDILHISNISHFDSDQNVSSSCHAVLIQIRGKRLGETTLVMKTTYDNIDPTDICFKDVTIEDEYRVVVKRAPLIETIIFRYGTAAFLVLLNFGFGCSLNLAVVKEILKKPIAPGVGFCCQYVMMPLIGFAVAMTLLQDDPLFAFGLICSSCSPGGAGSNVWCLLLGGDVSLSLTMTFFSLSASLGMMPLWLFLLGRFFIDTSTIKIPYLDIISNLCLFVVPCFIGVIFRRIRQNWADKVGKAIKPFALLFLVFLLTFGLYTNRYIYAQIAKSPYIIPPALLQPYFGFGVGFLVAMYIARQPKYRCITIAIETGVQNVTIPMVLLQGSFKQPYGDLAAVMPVTTAHFTPLPMIFAFLGLTIYKKFFKKENKDNVDTKEENILPNGTEISNGELSAKKENLSPFKKFPKKGKHEAKDFRYSVEIENLLRNLTPDEIETKLNRESFI